MFRCCHIAPSCPYPDHRSRITGPNLSYLLCAFVEKLYVSLPPSLRPFLFPPPHLHPHPNPHHTHRPLDSTQRQSSSPSSLLDARKPKPQRRPKVHLQTSRRHAGQRFRKIRRRQRNQQLRPLRRQWRHCRPRLRHHQRSPPSQALSTSGTS